MRSSRNCCERTVARDASRSGKTIDHKCENFFGVRVTVTLANIITRDAISKSFEIVISTASYVETNNSLVRSGKTTMRNLHDCFVFRSRSSDETHNRYRDCISGYETLAIILNDRMNVL